MAKFKTVGHIGRSKKDKDKYNLCIERGGVKYYFILSAKPDESMQAKYEWAKEKAEKWPEWKKYDVVEVVEGED